MRQRWIGWLMIVTLALLPVSSGFAGQVRLHDPADTPLLLVSDGEYFYAVQPMGREAKVIGSVGGRFVPQEHLVAHQGTMSFPQELPGGTPVSEGYFLHRGIRDAEGIQVVYTEVPIMEGMYQVWIAQRDQPRRLLFTEGFGLPDVGQLTPAAWLGDHIYFDTVLAYVPSAHFGLWKYDLTTETLTRVSIPGVKHYDQLLPTPDGSALIIGARDLGHCASPAVADPPPCEAADALGSKILSFDLESHQPTTIIESTDTDLSIVGWLASSAVQELEDHLARDEMTPQTVEPFLYWPLPNGFRTIVGYPGSYEGHRGTDIDVSSDATTPVHASNDGTVAALCNDEPDGYNRNINGCSGAGNFVRLVHDANGYYTMYYHLKRQSVAVNIGAHVHAGDLLGYAYNSGYTCGSESAATGCMGYPGSYSHLHFEVWSACGTTSCWVNPWNPYLWIGDPPSVPPWCCGCLPASCCSAATASSNGFSTEITWGKADPANRAARPAMKLVDPGEIPVTETSAAPTVHESVERDQAANQVDPGDQQNAPDALFASATDTASVPAERWDSAVDTPLALARVNVEAQLIPASSTTYRISKSVFGSGGGQKASAHFIMNSTQGQPTDHYRRRSASYVLVSGYWGRFTPLVYDFNVYLPVVTKDY